MALPIGDAKWGWLVTMSGVKSRAPRPSLVNRHSLLGAGLTDSFCLIKFGVKEYL